MRGAREFGDELIELMQRPSKRDLQVKIGPSNLGDPCDRCLGFALSGMLPDGPRAPKEPFNLMSWTGTACHQRWERDVSAERWAGIKQETKVHCGTIKGYGLVSGSADLYSKPHRTLFDMKNKNKAAIKYWMANGIAQMVRVQIQTYGRGIERAGLPIEEVGIFAVPRDSMSINDVWVYTEPYDPSVSKNAFKRAEKIWKEVQAGRFELLKTHPDCYKCNKFKREGITFVY